MRKKLLCICIMLIMLLIYSYSNKEYKIKTSDNAPKINQMDSNVDIDLSDEINDLLYRKYSKGVKLSANETMKIILPNFSKDQAKDVEIIIINNSMNRVENILKYKYTEDKSVSYSVKQVGVYTVYGITIDKNSKKELIDLTDRISYEKNYDISGSNYVY